MIDEKQTVTDDMMLMKLKKCKIIAASFFFVDTLYMYIYCYIKMQLLTDYWLEREHYSALIFIWY